MNLHEKLADIQQKINAPKSQYNKFGNYSHRNIEDILVDFKKVSNFVSLSKEGTFNLLLCSDASIIILLILFSFNFLTTVLSVNIGINLVMPISVAFWIIKFKPSFRL